MTNCGLKKRVTKATPQKYEPRNIRFHLDNGTQVDVVAENTLDAERQLKAASISTSRIVRISFDPADFGVQIPEYGVQ